MTIRKPAHRSSRYKLSHLIACSAMLVVLFSGTAVDADWPVPPGVQPGETYHIVFATSNFYLVALTGSYPPTNGEINSLAAADWQTTFSAFIAGLVPGWNGLDIHSQAILSDSMEDASTRLQISGAIYNTNGDKIADDAADLWDGNIQNPIGYDENGNLLEASSVWTGSIANGEFSGGQACGDWNDSVLTATTGAPNLQGPSWINSGSINCSDAARLYAISPPLIAPGAVILGDADGDGVFNNLDIASFVLALTNPKLTKPCFQTWTPTWYSI